MAERSEAGPAAKDKISAHSELYWLGGILILALLLRVIAAASREMIQFDEASYARMAENLLKGQLPWEITGTSATKFSILYPFVTAAFAVVIRNYVAAGYAVTVLFSSLMILPTYMLGKVMWSKMVGIAAAALVAVLPVLVDKGSLVDGESLYAFWLMCALFFGYRMQFTKRCFCGMLAGICLGFAYLSDPTALFYLVVLGTLLLLIGFRQDVLAYAAKSASHFLLLFLLFAVPYVVFLTYENGSFTLADRSQAELYAAVHGLEPGSLEQEERMLGLADDGTLNLLQLEEGPGIIASLVDDPPAVMKAAALRAYDYYLRNIDYLIPLLLLPLVGIGLHQMVWTRREALKYGYFLLVLSPLMFLPLQWPDARFMLPYMGIIMLWFARGWVYLEEWSGETASELAGWQGIDSAGKRKVRQLVAALVLLLLVGLSLWRVSGAEYPLEQKEAGLWLMDNGGEGARIMSRDAATPYYAGGTQVVLPFADEGELLAYGDREQVDYLVVSRGLVDQYRPQLKGLLEDPSRYERQGLKQIHRNGDAAGTSETVIFRWERG